MVSGSCFGVRVSVMFHFMFVHYTFSSVKEFHVRPEDVQPQPFIRSLINCGITGSDYTLGQYKSTNVVCARLLLQGRRMPDDTFGNTIRILSSQFSPR